MPIVVGHDVVRPAAELAYAAGLGQYRQRQQAMQFDLQRQAMQYANQAQLQNQAQAQRWQEMQFRQAAEAWQNKQQQGFQLERDRALQKDRIDFDDRNFGQQKDLQNLRNDNWLENQKVIDAQRFEERKQLAAQAQQAQQERDYHNYLLKPKQFEKRYQLSPAEQQRAARFEQERMSLEQYRREWHPEDYTTALEDIDARELEFEESLRDRPMPSPDEEIAQITRPATNDKGDQVGFWVKKPDGSWDLKAIRDGNAGKKDDGDGVEIAAKDYDAAVKALTTKDEGGTHAPSDDKVISYLRKRREALRKLNGQEPGKADTPPQRSPQIPLRPEYQMTPEDEAAAVVAEQMAADAQAGEARKQRNASAGGAYFGGSMSPEATQRYLESAGVPTDSFRPPAAPMQPPSPPPGDAKPKSGFKKPATVPFTWFDPATGGPNRDMTEREVELVNKIKLAPGTADTFVVTTEEEMSLLPPGTKYLAPNGKTYIKK